MHRNQSSFCSRKSGALCSALGTRPNALITVPYDNHTASDCPSDRSNNRSLWTLFAVWFVIFAVCAVLLSAQQLPAPTGLQLFPANGSTPSQLYFQWNRVVAPNGSYEVQIATNVAFTQSTQSIILPYSGLPVNLHLINGLLPYTTYYTRVRAISSMGTTGTFSAVTQGTTRAAGPEWLKVSNLSSGTSFTANWTPVTNATSYTLQMFVIGQQSSTFAGISTTSFTLNNLQPNVQYNYNVFAVMPNESISTAPSQNGIRLPPAQPVQLSATNVGVTSVTINWQSIIGAQNVSVQISPSMTFNQFGPSTSATLQETSKTVTWSFQPATTYYARVLASNNGVPVASTISNVVTFTTPAALINTNVVEIQSPYVPPGNGEYSVSVNSNVPWVATSNAPWLTVTPTSGNGLISSVVKIVSANTMPFPPQRTGVITFTSTGIMNSSSNVSKTITVIQAAAPDTLIVPASTTASASAGTLNFPVYSNLIWSATSDQPWLNVTTTQSGGMGARPFGAIYQANTTTGTRSAVITFSFGPFAPRTVVVTQLGSQAAPILEISSSSATVGGDSTSARFSITSNTAWTVVSNAAWLQPLTQAGSANGQLLVSVAANASSTPRMGTITVSGSGITRIFTVTQLASPLATPTLILSSTLATISADSITSGFSVSSNVAWTAQSNMPWVKLLATSGVGNGSILYTVAKNPLFIFRIGTITISGGGLTRTHTVYQNGAVADSLPAPQNVIATATMPQNFTVQWQPVQGASNYEIQYATNMNFTDNFFSLLTNNPTVLSSATPSWNFSATPGTTYFVRMRSVNASGLRSEFSAIDTASTPPNAPFMQPSSNISQTGFRVNWMLGDGAASYTLQISTNATFTPNGIIRTFQSITANNFMVTNQLLGVDMKAGATYFYRAQSISSAGVQSGFATGAVTIHSSQLTAPAGVLVNNISKTGFTVNWQAVAGASGYEVQVSTNVKFEVGNMNFAAQGGNTMTLQVNNLLPGSLRYVRVRTMDAANGGSAYSSGIPVTTLSPAPAVPLAATNIGTTSFTANWQNSPDGGTTTLEVILNTGIRVQYQPTGTSYTITNLQPGSVVFYHVRANGGGAATNPFSTQQIRVELQSNQAGLATPIAYIATNIGTDNAIAKWQLVAGATGYELQVASDVQFSNILMTYPLAGQFLSTPQFTLTGLPIGKISYYRIRALGANGVVTPFSNAVSVATMPATPVIAAPTALQAISFTANWLATAGAKYYQVQAATNTQFTQDLVNAYITAPLTSATFTVPAGKTYYYRVRAVGEAGSGLWSNSQMVTLPQGMVNSLVAFDAVNPSSTSFVALWQPIVGAMSYTVQVSPSRDFTLIVKTLNNIIGTSVQVSGLQAGFTYYWRVIANTTLANTKDGSRISNDGASNVVEVALPDDVPTALAATNVGTTGFTANWENVGDESRYILQVATDVDFTDILNLTLAPKQVTSEFVNVPFMKYYYYRVFAVGSNGAASVASNPIEVRMMTTSVRNTQTSGNIAEPRIYPNPANNNTMRSLELNLPESGIVAVRIYDMLGNGVAVQTMGYKAAGWHTITLLPESCFNTGVYNISIEQSGIIIARTRMIVGQ